MSHLTTYASGDEDEKVPANEAFFQALLQKVHSLYAPAPPADPSPSSGPSVILPPTIINTLASASISLHRPLQETRALLERWFALLPTSLLDSLAAAEEFSDEERKEEWWMDEALKGYTQLLERYLVEVLASRAEEDENGIEEAKKALDWDGVLGAGTKERIRARLLSQTPSQSPIAVNSSFTPSSPISSDDASLEELPHPPAKRSLNPSSPTSAAASPRPSSLPPSSSELVAYSLPILLIILAASIRSARRRGWLSRQATKEWLLRVFWLVWRDLKGTVALATTITYV